MVAPLVIVPVPVTVANRVRVADVALGSDPIVQTPVTLSYVPELGLAETKVRPAGSKSVTWTPVASEGPALKAVTVYVTGEPTMTVGLLAVLVTPTSAREVTVVGSLAESFAALTSPPPATVALFVTDPAADCWTATVIVMAGYDPAAASASDRVQVTTWATIPHVQPVPDALEGVSPAGSASETVTKPLLETGPTLLTVRL